MPLTEYKVKQAACWLRSSSWVSFLACVTLSILITSWWLQHCRPRTDHSSRRNNRWFLGPWAHRRDSQCWLRDHLAPRIISHPDANFFGHIELNGDDAQSNRRVYFTACQNEGAIRRQTQFRPLTTMPWDYNAIRRVPLSWYFDKDDGRAKDSPPE